MTPRMTPHNPSENEKFEWIDIVIAAIFALICICFGALAGNVFTIDTLCRDNTLDPNSPMCVEISGGEE